MDFLKPSSGSIWLEQEDAGDAFVIPRTWSFEYPEDDIRFASQAHLEEGKSKLASQIIVSSLLR
jgi:hypothetical protein